MKIEVLQIEPMMPEIQSRLETSYTMHKLFEAGNQHTLVERVAPNIRAIVTGGGLGASKEIISILPKLEIIAINGVGTDAVDLELARSWGIRVINTPEVLTEDVADLGMALVLAVLRQIAWEIVSYGRDVGLARKRCHSRIRQAAKSSALSAWVASVGRLPAVPKDLRWRSPILIFAP